MDTSIVLMEIMYLLGQIYLVLVLPVSLACSDVYTKCINGSLIIILLSKC